jgi:hypothetical protein
LFGEGKYNWESKGLDIRGKLYFNRYTVDLGVRVIVKLCDVSYTHWFLIQCGSERA